MSLKVNQVAELLGVSYVTVYKKIKKLKKELNGFVYKRNRATYLTLEAVELIKNDLGTRPAEPEEAGKEETFNRPENLNDDLSSVLKQQVDSLQREIKKRDEVIAQKDVLVNKLIEQQAGERHRSDTIIMQLTTQLKETRVLLEDLRQQVQDEAVPEYETVDARAVQDDIMEVDAVGEELVQDVVIMEECGDPPPAAAAEPARESLEPEEQGITATAAVEEAMPAKQEKTLAKQPHPKHSWGMFKRLWVNMFQPELLRESQG